MTGKHWETLRRWINWGVRRSKLELLITGAILPILECIFVNLLTGVKDGERAWPYVLTLVVLGLAHAGLLAMQLLPDANYPIQCVADAIEATDKVKELELDVARKQRIHNALRSAVDALNLQTCDMNPLGRDAFVNGIHPIFCSLISEASQILGVRSNEFTIEFYSEVIAVLMDSGCACIGNFRQQYYYSPTGFDPCRPVRLGQRSPCTWGAARRVPGICRVADDQSFFYENGRRPDDLYFQMICTVPVHQTCSDVPIGLLVLTSMQEEPFASDVTETMQFVASLISQYIAAHNRCVMEWQQRRTTTTPAPHIGLKT